jgi:hypothetical protein
MMGRAHLLTGYPFSFDFVKYGLPRLKRYCRDCGHSGLIDIGHGQDYRNCDTCHGDGGIPIFPPQVMLHYQQRARNLIKLERSVCSGRTGGRLKP